MFELIQFPSLIEGNNQELREVATDLLHGLKLYEKRRAYVLGNLALTEGVSPHKNINAAPGELEYQLLMKAALLLATEKSGNKRLAITTGFSSSTFPLYREQAVEVMQKEHIIEFDSATFSSGNRRNSPVSAEQVWVMPEIQGCVLGLRQGETKAKGSFFVVSLGFGTCEAIMSTESGTVQRTAVAANGLRYAVNLLMTDLGKQYYLELQNEHQIDQAFQKGFLFSNRKRVDLKDARERALQAYYQDVLSPALRRAFQDSDFQRADRLYLVGGGANYSDLVALFQQEFKDIVEIIVPNEPQAMAVTGYALNSQQHASAPGLTPMGLDLGNATTLLALPRQQKVNKPTESNQAAQQNGQPAEEAAKTKASPAPKAAPVNLVDDSLLEPMNGHTAPKPETPAGPPVRRDRLGKFLQTGMW
jgi:hypothetical protein